MAYSFLFRISSFNFSRHILLYGDFPLKFFGAQAKKIDHLRLLGIPNETFGDSKGQGQPPTTT